MSNEISGEWKKISRLQPICSIDEAPRRRSRPRFTHFLLTFVLMAIVWIIFSGMFDPFHLTLGAISCGLVAYFSSDLIFGEQSSLANFFVCSFRFLGYVPWLLVQIVKSNFWLMYLVFHPRMNEMLDPQVIEFKSGLTGTMSRLTLANSITLTPGTITVYVNVAGDFTVHAIDKHSAAGLPGEMERRIARVFGE
jgi:multicomponent Na+:H+ antiporter subunit E